MSASAAPPSATTCRSCSIAGPCQLESRDHAFDIAGRLKEMTAKAGIGLVYKTSFDKANRTSLTGRRGTRARGGAAGVRCAALRARACRSSPMSTSASSARWWRRWSTSCRSRPSSAARPTSWSRRPRPARRSTSRRASSSRRGTCRTWSTSSCRERQPQRPPHRARRELRLQHAGLRHAVAADHGRDRCAGDLRRHPLGPAAGRAGDRIGRRARASCRCWRGRR